MRTNMAIILLSIPVMTGCQKAETFIRVHNMGPDELSQVVVLIDGKPNELGTLSAGEESRIRVPPICGARVEVRFLGLPEDEHPLVIDGELPEDKYGEIIIGIKERRFGERLVGHPK